MTDLSIKNLSYVDNFKHTIMGNYANFKGRASRSEYWRFYGITIVIAGIINVLSALFMDTALASIFGLISMAYNVAILLPSIGLGVRRLHDVGKCLEAGYLGIFLTKQPTEYRNMTNNNGTETNLLEINNLLDLFDSFGASNIIIIDNSNGQLSEKENENLKIISQFVFMVKTDGSVEALHKAIDGIFNYVLTV